MSVKTAIKDMLPYSWEYVLREEKVLSKFCDYMYRDCVPIGWRNARCWKNSIIRIRQLTSCTSFLSCFNTQNTKEGPMFWESINTKIKNYEEACKLTSQ